MYTTYMYVSLFISHNTILDIVDNNRHSIFLKYYTFLLIVDFVLSSAYYRDTMIKIFHQVKYYRGKNFILSMD